MADEGQYDGFRARTAQLLTWLFGQRQQVEQPQTQKSDRQIADGYDRGHDDPDNRRRPQPLDTGREALQRASAQTQQPAVSREDHQPQHDTSLTARAQALRQQLQAEQQRQRGQGWGR
jgi:hypothetical protein